jgi:tyrosyl-tRNA synthetase
MRHRDKIAMPCETCGARDNRDAEHQRGCPQVSQLPKAELIRIARRIEAGWEAKKMQMEEARKLRALKAGSHDERLTHRAPRTAAPDVR